MAAVSRARVAVSAMFILYGLILGSWTARIPAIRQRLHLSDGRLSVGLLVFAAGAIVGMQLAGRLVDRYGSKRVLIPAVLADGALLVAPAAAANLTSLAICLLGFGLAHGTLNVAMNVNAVEVQRVSPRPIISSCHAIYSIGGFLGAAVGGLFAYARVGAMVNFVTIGIGVAVIATLMTTWVSSPPEPAGRNGEAGARPSRSRAAVPGVMFLGVLVFCCLVGEGAAADWSAVYLRNNLQTSAGFAASAYAVFSIAMMSGRLVGDRLAALVGPVWLVRVGGVLAAVSLSLALLIGNPITGVLGFGFFGIGLSCIAPQAFAAAGNRDAARAGQAIARVAGLGFLGFVVGPVVIGTTAQLLGLPHALLIPALLALFVALSAAALGPNCAYRRSPRGVDPLRRSLASASAAATDTDPTSEQPDREPSQPPGRQS